MRLVPEVDHSIPSPRDCGAQSDHRDESSSKAPKLLEQVRLVHSPACAAAPPRTRLGFRGVWVTAVVACGAVAPGVAGVLPEGAGSDGRQAAAAPASDGPLPLSKCIEIALEKSRRRPLSQFAVSMAEAQHRQALSGYWPQVKATGGYQRLDEPLNFLFPASSLPIPGQSLTVPGGTMMVTVPANAFAPGFPPTSLQLPVSFPGQTITTAAQAFAIPEQNIKVLDRDVVLGSLDVKWLLFDGGMRRGYREQAAGQVAMMRQEVRRTDLEITDSVKRLYWGAVLARQLHQLGLDTLARMVVTLELTESLYKEGSGKVTKADYLDNDVAVESLRSMVAHLEKNEKMTQAALANTMGLDWTANVRPAAEEIPFGRGYFTTTRKWRRINRVGEPWHLRSDPKWGDMKISPALAQCCRVARCWARCARA